MHFVGTDSTGSHDTIARVPLLFPSDSGKSDCFRSSLNILVAALAGNATSHLSPISRPFNVAFLLLIVAFKPNDLASLHTPKARASFVTVNEHRGVVLPAHFVTVPSVSMSPWSRSRRCSIPALKYNSGICLFFRTPIFFNCFFKQSFVLSLMPSEIFITEAFPGDLDIEISWPISIFIAFATWSKSTSPQVKRGPCDDPSPSHKPKR